MTKLTKKYYMGILRQRLKERTFDREQFKQEFSLSDRKVRRYINEIAEEFAQIKSPELAILKQYCIENLTEKASKKELNEKTETQIALSGEVAKTEQKVEGAIIIKAWDLGNVKDKPAATTSG